MANFDYLLQSVVTTDSAVIRDALFSEKELFREFLSPLNQFSMFAGLSRVHEKLSKRPDIVLDIYPEFEKLPPSLVLGEFDNAANLLHSFVNIVYGRSDDLMAALRTAARRSKSEELALAIKLVDHDDVRKLRNALAHGTTEFTGDGLDYWNDDKVRYSITNVKLKLLNRSIRCIFLWCFAASVEANGVGKQ